MKTFPILYHKGKNGELRQWRTWSDQEVVYTEYGTVNGALQTSNKKCESKNVGRSNETTPIQQADLESHSLHTFKLERKYSLTPEAAQLPLLLPMLAHKYDPKKHKGSYYAQPKFDGVRCIARWESDKIVLYSRQGKIYDVKHISDELETFMGPDDVYDGELYVHNMALQSIISLVKKPKPGSEKLEYHVYDVPVCNGDDDLGFSDRFWPKLAELFGHNAIKPVRTVRLHYKEPEFEFVLNQYQTEFVASGYEGLILRGTNSKYLWGYRSNELLKVKTFQDSEFEVIGIEEGIGKMAGHAIVVCQNDLTTAMFRVAPKSTMEVRKEIFDNQNKYIGRFYTVKYFDRTEDQIPRFPVGLAFREDI